MKTKTSTKHANRKHPRTTQDLPVEPPKYTFPDLKKPTRDPDQLGERVSKAAWTKMLRDADKRTKADAARAADVRARRAAQTIPRCPGLFSQEEWAILEGIDLESLAGYLTSRVIQQLSNEPRVHEFFNEFITMVNSKKEKSTTSGINRPKKKQRS